MLADLHTHTSVHGYHSAAGMLRQRRRPGLDLFGLSEHSPCRRNTPASVCAGLSRQFPDFVRTCRPCGSGS